MNASDDQKPEPPADNSLGKRPIPSSSLFQGQQQVLIQHDGEIYRLVLTRNNKLLLQK